MVKFDPGQRTVLVRQLAEQGQAARVLVVPNVSRDRRVLVGLGTDRGVLGADSSPAALGLDRAMARLGVWLAGAESGAVRDLIEAVAQCLRADSKRLEEDVVT